MSIEEDLTDEIYINQEVPGAPVTSLPKVSVASFTLVFRHTSLVVYMLIPALIFLLYVLCGAAMQCRHYAPLLGGGLSLIHIYPSP